MPESQKSKQGKREITRRKFLQVSLIGTTLGIGLQTFTMGEASSEEELRGLKVELSDGSIIGLEIPEKVVSKKELEKIIKKISGKKFIFPRKIGNLQVKELKNREFFDLYFKPSEVFLTEYFTPDTMGDFVYQEEFIYQEVFIFMDEIIATALIILAFAIIAVFMLIVAFIAIPIPLEEASVVMSERNKLIQQMIWNLGEFPIFVESPRGTVCVKLIDLPDELRVEFPIRNKIISIPVETDFGSFVRNIRFPEKEIGEDFFLKLLEYIDSKTGNAVIPIESEGEQIKVIIPKEILQNFKMLKKALRKK